MIKITRQIRDYDTELVMNSKRSKKAIIDGLKQNYNIKEISERDGKTFVRTELSTFILEGIS